MRHFKRYFALLFLLSTLVGSLHEVIHHHHHDMDPQTQESCGVYLLAQIPVLLSDSITITLPEIEYEPFLQTLLSQPTAIVVFTRNRSPPLA